MRMIGSFMPILCAGSKLRIFLAVLCKRGELFACRLWREGGRLDGGGLGALCALGFGPAAHRMERDNLLT